MISASLSSTNYDAYSIIAVIISRGGKRQRKHQLLPFLRILLKQSIKQINEIRRRFVKSRTCEWKHQKRSIRQQNQHAVTQSRSNHYLQPIDLQLVSEQTVQSQTSTLYVWQMRFIEQ